MSYYDYRRKMADSDQSPFQDTKTLVGRIKDLLDVVKVNKVAIQNLKSQRPELYRHLMVLLNGIIDILKQQHKNEELMRSRNIERESLEQSEIKGHEVKEEPEYVMGVDENGYEYIDMPDENGEMKRYLIIDEHPIYEKKEEAWKKRWGLDNVDDDSLDEDEDKDEDWSDDDNDEDSDRYEDEDRDEDDRDEDEDRYEDEDKDEDEDDEDKVDDEDRDLDDRYEDEDRYDDEASENVQTDSDGYHYVYALDENGEIQRYLLIDEHPIYEKKERDWRKRWNIPEHEPL